MQEPDGSAGPAVWLPFVCGNNEPVPTEIERLYREHRAGLVRLVERELHDHHDAEDVVQTAFIDAQRALERGTIPRNPHAWLAAIALNAGRRLRRRRLNAEPLEEYAAREASGIPEIRAALASLPPEQRAAVVYRDLLGLSYDETAEHMGTSVNAVTMLLHRGRRRLRQTLGVTVAGIGLWRWVRRVGMPQLAAAKGAATIVVAAGLATTGIVTARAVAPVGSDTAGGVATDTVATGPATRAGTPRTVLAPESARRDLRTAGSSRVSVVSASTQGSDGTATSTPGAEASTSEPAPSTSASPSTSTLGVPTVPLPALPIPTTPTTVAVSTPVATVTATIPTVTTVTVTTPITTLTVPIP